MRLSVTVIEAYRLFRDFNWMSLEAIEATIKGEPKSTPAMKLGRAFHKVIEDPGGTLITAPQGDYHQWGYYSFEDMRQVFEWLPARRLTEIKMATPIAGHTVVGKVDSIHGVTVYEAKCVMRSVAADGYHESYQWRYYLRLFQAKQVLYLVAQAHEDRKEQGHFKIRSVSPFTMYGYPGLYADLERMTEEVAEFITRRGLEEYVDGSRTRAA